MMSLNLCFGKNTVVFYTSDDLPDFYNTIAPLAERKSSAQSASVSRFLVSL